jgi:acetate kinase
MGGLDAVVFTGGIGENDHVVRERVCENMQYLGIELDQEKNNNLRGPADISKPSSRAKILLVPTNEELMIARETAQVVSANA